MPKHLILIDIDGTLLYPGLTPRRSLAAAIQKHTGQAIEFTVPMLAGMTDPLIVTNALQQLGTPESDGLPGRILATYLDILAEHYPQANDHYLYPGVEVFLRWLGNLPLRLGLITGNLERGAMIKLAPFGLAAYFSMGVFSSDHADRDQLPLIALEKCKARFNEEYSRDRVIIVGDTFRDVRCARRNGMRAIAVIRHAERRAAIEAEKPDLIVEGFEDLTPIMDYIKQLL